jgi:hypothetical protein
VIRTLQHTASLCPHCPARVETWFDMHGRTEYLETPCVCPSVPEGRPKYQHRRADGRCIGYVDGPECGTVLTHPRSIRCNDCSERQATERKRRWDAENRTRRREQDRERQRVKRAEVKRFDWQKNAKARKAREG